MQVATQAWLWTSLHWAAPLTLLRPSVCRKLKCDTQSRKIQRRKLHRKNKTWMGRQGGRNDVELKTYGDSIYLERTAVDYWIGALMTSG